MKTIAGLSLAAMTTVLASLSGLFQSPGTPLPAAACPSSHEKTHEDTITKIGVGSTQEKAKARAKREVTNALNGLPGSTAVVCDNCPNGIQCARTAEASNITEGECEQDSISLKWYCSASHTGAYTVKCADC